MTNEVSHDQKLQWNYDCVNKTEVSWYPQLAQALLSSTIILVYPIQITSIVSNDYFLYILNLRLGKTNTSGASVNK